MGTLEIITLILLCINLFKAIYDKNIHSIMGWILAIINFMWATIGTPQFFLTH